MKKITLFASCLLLVWQLAAQPNYEFRAAWIATVDNIDWPTRGNYDPAKQREEFIQLLEMHKANGMNAIVMQIRPATDAFYPSELEPWSEWLTGKQGLAPKPYYDPLQFMIEETHKRGMEFHAWLNPYRAVFNIQKSSIAPNHITKTKPHLFLDYGGKRYFDPGIPEGQDFVVKVIEDIVTRYKVDAIHFDDYFYPYRIPKLEFPDEQSYRKYGNGLSKNDWRRSNVDSIIVKLNRAIKNINPLCKFGISPFGIWRNAKDDDRGSNTNGGQTNYDDLYADILLWLENDWIDYVVPQLYWEFEHKAAPYGPLLDWWSKNSFGKHCYIGLGIYKANTNAFWRDKTQLPRQVAAIRETPNVQGAVYFSSKSFVSNPNGWSDSLKNNYYKEPALIPEMPWLEGFLPKPPVVHEALVMNDTFKIIFNHPLNPTTPIKEYLLYENVEVNENYVNKYTSKLVQTIGVDEVLRFEMPVPKNHSKVTYFITSKDIKGNEGKPYINWPVKLKFEKRTNGWIHIY